MTFEDDMCQINFEGGMKRISCNDLRLTWPPPSTINIGGFKFERIRYSQITDEQREGMTNVFRGAEYSPAGQS